MLKSLKALHYRMESGWSKFLGVGFMVVMFITYFPSPSLTISPVPQELPNLTSPVTFSEEGPLLSKCELYMVSL